MFLNTEQLSDFLKERINITWTSNYIRFMRSRGSGPPYVKLRNRVYYKPDDVLNWINLKVENHKND